MSSLSLPRNVTDHGGFVLGRIARGKVTRTRRFPYEASSAKDRTRAVLHAQAWVVLQIANLPDASNGRGCLRRRPLGGKRSGEPVGVSRTVVPSRTDGAVGSLRYMVNWVDGRGRARVKTFVAGCLDVIGPRQVTHARNTAIAFRQAYERAVKRGERFDPSAFDNWREAHHRGRPRSLPVPGVM